jgi:hypothetical protein
MLGWWGFEEFSAIINVQELNGYGSAGGPFTSEIAFLLVYVELHHAPTCLM